MNLASAAEITRLGYNTVEVISDTGRNRSLKLQKDNQFYFAKLNLTKDQALIENDVWWCLTLDRLKNANPDLLVKPPKIIQFGKGWYISEFVPGQALTSAWEISDEELEPYTAMLATILSQLDTLMVTVHDQPLYESSESAPYTNLLKKVDGWMEQPLATGLITAAQLKEAKSVIEKNRLRIMPALQHGDFVPWHFMISAPNEPLIIIDGEHASLVKPRYYDLACIYTRLVTRTNAAAQARRLLKDFLAISKLDQSDFFTAFLPVVTLRALGMQTDALADQKRLDYRLKATDLLERCLSQDFSSLIMD